MGLPAGILRETVVIEYATEVQNALGEPMQTWHTYARRRASVEATGYSEQQRIAQNGGSASHVVRMRYVEGMTGAMRLRWSSRRDRLLQITSVVERNDREEHELLCEEKVT